MTDNQIPAPLQSWVFSQKRGVRCSICSVIGPIITIGSLDNGSFVGRCTPHIAANPLLSKRWAMLFEVKKP